MLVAKRLAGVASEVNLRNPLLTANEAQKRGDPPWLWNPGQMSPEVQNRGISGHIKETDFLQNIFLIKGKYLLENSFLSMNLFKLHSVCYIQIIFKHVLENWQKISSEHSMRTNWCNKTSRIQRHILKTFVKELSDKITNNMFFSPIYTWIKFISSHSICRVSPPCCGIRYLFYITFTFSCRVRITLSQTPSIYTAHVHKERWQSG